MSDFEFMNVFSSGRYDRSLRKVKKATKFYKGYRRTSLVHHTEMTDDARLEIFMEKDGWGFNRSPNGDGADDSVTEWDRSVWELENKDTLLLSDIKFKREGGGLSGSTYAAKTLLTHNDVRLGVWAFHLPQYDIPARREISNASMRALVEDVKHELKIDRELNVILTGDYNLNYRVPNEHLILTKMFAPVGLRCNWKTSLPTNGGTFGNQLICMQWHNMVCVKTGLLPDDNSSDHRPAFASYIV